MLAHESQRELTKHRHPQELPDASRNQQSTPSRLDLSRQCLFNSYGALCNLFLTEHLSHWMYE